MASPRDSSGLKRVLDVADRLGRLRQRLSGDGDDRAGRTVRAESRRVVRAVTTELERGAVPGMLGRLHQRHRFGDEQLTIVLLLLERRNQGVRPFLTGRELIAFSPRHGDGGLWDEHFDLVVPFPDDDRPGKYLEVHDLLGLGVDQLVVWDERRLCVYGPARRPTKRRRRYAPLRPGPNLSNYQVNYSLPRWA